MVMFSELVGVCGDTDIVYHYSDEKYSDIRSLRFIKGKDEYKDEIRDLIGSLKFRVYETEISFLIPEANRKHVDELIKEGFDNWKPVKYKYYVSLKENKKNIEYVRLMSVPEMNRYHDSHWSEWYSRHKKLSEKDFFKARKKYDSDMWEAINLKEQYTVDEYLKEKEDRKWCNMDYFTDLNIKDGSKRQYATMIPHIIVGINKPLKISKREVI